MLEIWIGFQLLGEPHLQHVHVEVEGAVDVVEARLAVIGFVATGDVAVPYA